MIRRQACPQTLVLCLAEPSLCQQKPNQPDPMALFADPMLRLAELSLCQRELSRSEPDPILYLAEPERRQFALRLAEPSLCQKKPSQSEP